MNKMWIVARREFLMRVRKRSFLLATFLVPIGILALIGISGWITASSMESSSRVLVKDRSGIMEDALSKKSDLVFSFSDRGIDQLRKTYQDDGYDLLIDIPPISDLSRTQYHVSYYSKEKPGLSLIGRIESAIGQTVREHKITSSEIDRKIYESFSTKISLEPGVVTGPDGETFSEPGTGKMAVAIGTGLGFLMGFMMYIVILIYGQLVMRSVMEEKISRIAEVMISSIKPFDLMLGKMLGVGAVGLAQIALWLLFIPIVFFIVSMFIPDMAGTEGAEAMKELEMTGFDLALVMEEVSRMNWLLIIPGCILYFLGGYFIYSSMFAAIGSAVDQDLGEAQQFTIPIIIPVILSFIIAMSGMENPNSSIAVFGSVFPLTSPIVMPTRLPFDPPGWQILLSVILLVLSTWFLIWLSARIYRVGILLYGQKVTFKELGRWMIRGE